MSDYSVFITGAAGFLGTYIAEACRKTGMKIVGIDLNPPREIDIFEEFYQLDCATADYDAILSDHMFTHIFHLAGSASVPFSVENPEGDFSSLLPATARLLASMGRLQGRKPKICLISSAAVYGNPRNLPILESDDSTPLSPYGVHKLMAESMVQHYGRIYGFNSTVMRVFSAYGPGLRKQLIWDVCCRMLDADNRNDTIEIFGTGTETRDFIHAKDVAAAALLIAKNSNDGHEVFNLASGMESTVASVCSRLSEALGDVCNYSFNLTVRQGDPLFWRANIVKLESIGFSPSVSFSEGLSETALWVRSVQK